MKRSCLDCPAYVGGVCQIDGHHHLDLETALAAGCPWDNALGDMPMKEMLATLEVCCKAPKPACFYCPFKHTHLCSYLLASPASIETGIQTVIKEFASPDDELPF